MAKKETVRKEAPRPAAMTVRSPARPADEVAAAAQATRKVDHEEIARRAYQRFVERGGKHGQDQDDWLRAENELEGG